MICPYCKKKAKWCENKEIYGKNYGKSYMCYLCKECDAYVGCHQNTKRPLGTMANSELRSWRVKAHKHIDQFGKLTRKQVYYKLKQQIGKSIHIGEADIEMCKKILTLEL